ncbi:MAG: TolC family protein, partial [Planctomycetaceae bacterium]|nr:TolC family protein [Planctomycetaceae bacterium]
NPLNVGVPAQLLSNRPDVRQAERELSAAGLDIEVARARFYPSLNISAGLGYEAFNPKYLFLTPEALIYNVAGELVGPLINRRSIQAEYRSANAKQIQAVYNYQRTVLNAYTEVVNNMSKVQNYGESIETRKQQIQALETSVKVATQLFEAARAEYVEVLLAQREMMEARMVLIDAKRQQLSAVINTYQALGGGAPIGQ